MQHAAGLQYGQGAAAAHQSPPFAHADLSQITGGTTTSSLRQFRKKDDKPTTDLNSVENSHIARVAPHSHYPARPNEYYRYQHQYPDYNSPFKESPAPVKYSEIAETPQHVEHVAKHKEVHKDFMDMCNLNQPMKQAYQQAYPPDQPVHYKPESQYQQYPQMAKYSQCRKYPENDFLAKLQRINPTMARSIMSDHHIRESQAAYPGYQNQRYYPPSHLQNYNQYQYGYPSCNYPRANQYDRSLSPRNMHMMNYPAAQKVSPTYAQYQPAEYAQHYQHRRAPMPQEFYQQPCRTAGYSHQISPEPTAERSSSGGLRQFLENWAEEEGSAEITPIFKENVRVHGEANSEQVFVINSSDIPLENVSLVPTENGQYIIKTGVDSVRPKDNADNSDRTVNLHIVEAPKPDCMLEEKAAEEATVPCQETEKDCRAKADEKVEETSVIVPNESVIKDMPLIDDVLNKPEEAAEEKTEPELVSSTKRAQRIFSVDDIINNIGSSPSQTRRNSLQFTPKGGEEAPDEKAKEAEEVEYENAISVENDSVILELGGVWVQLKVNHLNGTKVLSVVPLSDSVVIDVNGNYQDDMESEEKTETNVEPGSDKEEETDPSLPEEKVENNVDKTKDKEECDDASEMEASVENIEVCQSEVIIGEETVENDVFLDLPLEQVKETPKDINEVPLAAEDTINALSDQSEENPEEVSEEKCGSNKDKARCKLFKIYDSDSEETVESQEIPKMEQSEEAKDTNCVEPSETIETPEETILEKVIEEEQPLEEVENTKEEEVNSIPKDNSPVHLQQEQESNNTVTDEKTKPKELKVDKNKHLESASCNEIKVKLKIRKSDKKEEKRKLKESTDDKGARKEELIENDVPLNLTVTKGEEPKKDKSVVSRRREEKRKSRDGEDKEKSKRFRSEQRTKHRKYSKSEEEKGKSDDVRKDSVERRKSDKKQVPDERKEKKEKSLETPKSLYTKSQNEAKIVNVEETKIEENCSKLEETEKLVEDTEIKKDVLEETKPECALDTNTQPETNLSEDITPCPDADVILLAEEMINIKQQEEEAEKLKIKLEVTIPKLKVNKPEDKTNETEEKEIEKPPTKAAKKLYDSEPVQKDNKQRKVETSAAGETVIKIKTIKEKKPKADDETKLNKTPKPAKKVTFSLEKHIREISKEESDKKKLSWEEYNSRKRKSSPTGHSIMENTVTSTNDLNDAKQVPENSKESSQKCPKLTSNWEDESSSPEAPVKNEVMSTTTRKSIIDVNEFSIKPIESVSTPSPVSSSQFSYHSEEDSLQVYKDVVDSKLNSLNIQIPKPKPKPVERLQVLLDRFLNKGTLNCEELEEVKKFIDIKRKMMEEKRNLFEVNNKARKGAKRKKKRFRNLYAEDSSDDTTDSSEKAVGDYSVYQRDSQGVPKLIFKRKSGLPQPFVKLERSQQAELMAKKRKLY